MRSGAHAADDNWRSPTLILLDLNLPRLNGREVLQRIRATPELRNVPVIVLSTSNRPQDVGDLYAAGANTYINKPQEFGRFVEVLKNIQRLLAGHRLAALIVFSFPFSVFSQTLQTEN